VVTCSFGATSWQPDAESTADDLIHLADDALYMAKHQGRNRVAVLTPPGAESAAQHKLT
jgi:PleD family two-component response regulator